MASMTIGELLFKMTGDSTQLKKELEAAKNKAQSTGKVFGALRGTLLRVFAVGAIVAFGKKVVGLASDAAETKQKFGVTFSSISDKADETAKNLAGSFGLSTAAAQDMLASTGNLLQAFGMAQEESLKLSDGVQQLAADVASFSNAQGGALVVSQAITKAMLGETEQAKMYGMILSDGAMDEYATSLGKVWKNLDKTEKAQLYLNKAQADQKNALGDFAWSSSSLANVQRTLLATLEDTGVAIGGELTPAFVRLGMTLSNSAKSGGSLAAVFGVIGKVAGTVVDVIGILINGLNIVFSQMKKDSPVFKTMALEAQAALKAGQKAGETTAEWKTRQAALNKVLGTTGSVQKEAAAQFEASWKGVKAGLRGVGESWGVVEAKQNKANRSAKETTEAQENAAKASAKAPKEAEDELDAYNKTLAKTNNGIIDLIANWANASKISDTMKRLSAQTALAAGAFGEISNIIGNISAYQQAAARQQIDALDAQMQKEMEAAGVAESTAVQKAESELAEAQESGDGQRIIAAQNALTKAQIEEKYAKKKTKLEYEMNLQAWKMQRLQVIAQGAQAVLSAYSSAAAIPLIGWLLAPIAAAAAGAAAALQIATVAKSKPTPPAMATGGIVPGSQQGTVVRMAENNKPEAILNQDQMRNFLDLAEGKGASGGMTFTPIPKITKGEVLDMIFKASQDGTLCIAQRAVVAR